jgi:hypothetical protein
MSDYTPTTEHVRAQYARQENYDPYFEGDWYLTEDGQHSAEEFDRWLAEVEKKAKAQAWDECAKYYRNVMKADFESNFGNNYNPYKSEQ